MMYIISMIYGITSLVSITIFVAGIYYIYTKYDKLKNFFKFEKDKTKSTCTHVRMKESKKYENTNTCHTLLSFEKDDNYVNNYTVSTDKERLVAIGEYLEDIGDTYNSIIVETEVVNERNIKEEIDEWIQSQEDKLDRLSNGLNNYMYLLHINRFADNKYLLFKSKPLAESYAKMVKSKSNVVECKITKVSLDNNKLVEKVIENKIKTLNNIKGGNNA